MNRPQGFEKTQSKRFVTLPYCECRLNPGRTHCFNCTVQPDYGNGQPRFSNITVYPSWWDTWVNKSILTQKDLDFLYPPKREQGFKKYVPRKKYSSYRKAW